MQWSRSCNLIGLLALLAVPAAYGQSDECQTVEFSDAVMERFPGVREGCLDVIERNGEKFAVFKADLIRTGRNQIGVRFKRPDGSRGSTRTIQVDPSKRVLVEGKPVRVEDLSVGQELTAYVRVTEPMVAFAPATAAEPLDFHPLPPEEQKVAQAEPSAMPETASSFPAQGLTGIGLLLLGGLLTASRWLRAPRKP